MFKAYENTIIITRGDSACFEIDVLSPEGEPVELDESTLVTFTVKKTVNDTDALITKYGTSVTLLPEDTSTLAYGDYVYDVQLTYQDGNIETIITPSRFEVTGEVTW